MLASVSSHVGRSVGWSGDFSAHEKQHEFSRHEHEFSHEQHDFFHSMGTIFRENSMNKRTLNRFSCRMLVGTRWEEVQ